jgi:predicted permease
MGRASPFGHTALSVTLVVALGVGAAMAVLGVFHQVFVGSARYEDVERLVILENRGLYDLGIGKVETPQLSWPDFEDIATNQHFLSALGGLTRPELSVWDAGDRARSVWRVFADEHLMGVVGARALHGRVLIEGDFRPGAPPVGLVTERLWRRQLRSDLGVLDRVVRVDGAAVAVVGIVADDVIGFLRERRVLFDDEDQLGCLILPMAAGSSGRMGRLLALRRLNRGRPMLTVVGRLRPGVTVDAASLEARTIAQRLARDYPETNGGRSLVVSSLTEWRTRSIQRMRPMLGAVATLALLAACASAVGLILLDAIRREPEMAVRHALGASPGRLSVLVMHRYLRWVLPGGVLGLVLARAALAWIDPAAEADTADVLFNRGLLAVAATVTVLTWLALGAAGILVVRRQNLMPGLKDAGQSCLPSRHRRFVLSTVMTIQIAAVTSLGLVSGLVIRSVANVMSVDLGFDVGSSFIIRVFLPGDDYRSAEAQSELFNEILARIRDVPGVTAAGLSNTPPLSRAVATSGGYQLEIPERSPQTLGVLVSQHVSPGYFESIGMQVARGRGFSEEDYRSDAPVMVVDEAFCRIHFQGVDPLRAAIRVRDKRHAIVGVVRDVRQDGPTEDARATVYVLRDSNRGEGLVTHVVVRPSARTETVMEQVVREVVRLDRRIVVDDPQTLDSLFTRATADRQRTLRLLLLGAVVVFFLTVFSISGALGELVEQKTRELALRRALGASSPAIAGLLLRHVGVPYAAGLFGGSVAGWFLTRTLSTQMFGLAPADPPTIAAGVTAVLALGLVLAAAGPLRRAARILPAKVLRAE